MIVNKGKKKKKHEVSDFLSKIYAVIISCTQHVKTTNSKRGNNMLLGITHLLKLYNSKREHLQHRRLIGGGDDLFIKYVTH